MMENTLSIGLLMISNSLSDFGEKEMLSRWQAEYERYKRRKQQPLVVLAAIGEGYDTLSEISAHTGMNITTLRRICQRLVQQKKIREIRKTNLNSQTILSFEII